MLKQLLLGVAVLAVVGGVAYAENSSLNAPQANVQVAQADDNTDAPPPPPGNDDQQGGNGGNHGGWWEWRHHGQNNNDRGGDHRGWGMGQGGGDDHGGPGMRGPGMHGPGGLGMMMGMGPHNGFRIQLGKGISIGVQCGKEAIKDCIADAQPLIDAAKAVAQTQASAPAPAKQ